MGEDRKISLKCVQSKGNDYSIANYTPTKFQMYYNTVIFYTQYEFHESPFTAYQVIAENGKKSLKCRQSKGNNSSLIENTLMKLHVHNHTMLIYILLAKNLSYFRKFAKIRKMRI